MKISTGFSDSLKSVIDGAKEHLHKGYSDMISTESLVSVPEIMRDLEFVRNVSADVTRLCLKKLLVPVVGNAVPEEEEQIEGQMNLTEWIEAEREREKYADQVISRNSSISELERALMRLKTRVRHTIS